MIYTPMTKLAMKIAYDAHNNQVDKSGLPYIFHPFYLAMQMDSEEATVVALLHDVVEDSDITLDDLLKHGFSARVIATLKLLSHKKSIPYLAYILEIKSNELARKVKLADLKHNSDVSRLEFVDEEVETRIEKYHQAIRLLEDESR